jgi:hypothetical protein
MSEAMNLRQLCQAAKKGRRKDVEALLGNMKQTQELDGLEVSEGVRE